MIARVGPFSGKGQCSPLCTDVIDSLPLHKANYTLQLILHADVNPVCSSKYTKLYTDPDHHSEDDGKRRRGKSSRSAKWYQAQQVEHKLSELPRPEESFR